MNYISSPFLLTLHNRSDQLSVIFSFIYSEHGISASHSPLFVAYDFGIIPHSIFQGAKVCSRLIDVNGCGGVVFIDFSDIKSDSINIVDCCDRVMTTMHQLRRRRRPRQANTNRLMTTTRTHTILVAKVSQ